MAVIANRQIVLVETPKDKLGPQHFRLTEAPMPAPQDGEVCCASATSRSTPPTAPGCRAQPTAAAVGPAVMAGGAMAEVVESKAPGFTPGDLVFADTGWQDYVALPASGS